MQIPAIDDFRKVNGPTYGRPWHVNLADADFTLTIPDIDVLFEDDDAWKPHPESYEMALRVLRELDGIKQKAAEYLAGIVDADRHWMRGESYFNQMDCDARTGQVRIAMTWEADIYAEWSVTLVWREREDGSAPEYRPIAMGYRNR
jgi:hypothetical protein